MSYLAIYRKFRPATFDEMIGQEHIVKTLTNQITSGRIGHAYLFCGTRGTGKTTTAKIFARAINCEHPVNGSPCGTCATCRALSDPANLDILEMDAASNNKVENVREIRDKVQYPPVAGKYKVYIIDEVHMLTTEAFNALLKTLEEPPAHAVFILATTEQHKLPATILSRCMRFDFKLVPDKLIAERIEKIYRDVGKDFEKEAVAKIASAGEGCVRDALSIADLCLSYSDKKLTYNDVIDVLGASDNTTAYKLAEGMFTSDTAQAVAITEELCSSGKSVALMCKDMLGILRDVLIVKTCKNYRAVLTLPEGELATLASLAEQTDEHRLLRALEIFSSLENELKYSSHPRVVFETAVLKATIPQEDYNMDALISRISKLEKQLAEISEKGIKVPVYVDERQKTAETTVAARVAAEPVQSVETATVNDYREQPLSVETKATTNARETSEETIETKFTKDIGAEEKPLKKASQTSSQTSSFDDFLNRDYAAESYGDDGYEQGCFEGLIPPEQDKPFVNDESESEKTAQSVAVESERISEQKVPEKPVSAPVSNAETAAKQSASVNVNRLWGTLVRRLRADKNIMLWIACQDAEPIVSGDKLVVYLEGENEYNLLSKRDNIAVLQNIVSAECQLNVEIRLKNAAPDTFEEDVEKMRKVLGKVDVVE